MNTPALEAWGQALRRALTDPTDPRWAALPWAYANDIGRAAAIITDGITDPATPAVIRLDAIAPHVGGDLERAHAAAQWLTGNGWLIRPRGYITAIPPKTPPSEQTGAEQTPQMMVDSPDYRGACAGAQA